MLNWLALILSLLMPPASAAEAPVEVDRTIQVRQDAGGDLVLLKGTQALNPDEFARLVGDTGTYRAYNYAYKKMILGCWALWGMGAVLGGSGLTMLTMSPLASMPEVLALSGVGVALTGMVSLATGSAVYARSRARINDPATWYTFDSASRWTATARSPRIELRPVFTGSGLALAARW